MFIKSGKIYFESGVRNGYFELEEGGLSIFYLRTMTDRKIFKEDFIENFKVK